MQVLGFAFPQRQRGREVVKIKGQGTRARRKEQGEGHAFCSESRPKGGEQGEGLAFRGWSRTIGWFFQPFFLWQWIQEGKGIEVTKNQLIYNIQKMGFVWARQGRKVYCGRTSLSHQHFSW
jgi:hypothetical protein